MSEFKKLVDSVTTYQEMLGKKVSTHLLEKNRVPFEQYYGFEENY